MRLAGCTFAPHLGPVGLLERLRELCTAAERHIIRYGDSFEAAALIHRRWSTS
ncbi:MAG: hypothetical protein ACMVY4_07370 [Minwuia sp.]|uniref:hypothetical protein n=1 Tax=Minwuia sp. TaxID=2493630 RepID=UPI003A8A640B